MNSTPSAPFDVRGIVPIINTPFGDDGRIDFRSLERLLDRGIREGITGCILPAVASEVSKLSESERRDLVRAAAEVIDGRIAIVAGVSSEDAAQTMRLAEHALSLGIDTVLCQVPQRLDGDTDGIRAHFRAVADVGAPTLMIQDLAWSGWGMPIELIVQMYEEIETFTAIKIEVSPAGSKYSAVLDGTGGGIHVSCGWGLSQMIEALDRGVKAFTTTAINYPFVRVFDLYAAGRHDEASELFDRMAPCLVWCQQHIDISIHFLKQYCVRVGVFDTMAVREPIMPFDDIHRRIGARIIEDVIAIEDELWAECGR